MTQVAANELKPWLKEQWCIPPKKNAEFVYHYEVFSPEEARRLTNKLEIHYTWHPWKLVKYGRN